MPEDIIDSIQQTLDRTGNFSEAESSNLSTTYAERMSYVRLQMSWRAESTDLMIPRNRVLL